MVNYYRIVWLFGIITVFGKYYDHSIVNALRIFKGKVP